MSNHTPYFPSNITEYAPWVAKRGLLYPYGKCQCGCGQDTPIATYNGVAQQYKKGHPIPFVRYHHKLRGIDKAFWAHVDKRGPDDCWEWTSTRDRRGYGAFTWNARPYRAYRFSYELHYGPIPSGLSVLHRCDNPPCCNPTHLWLGTQYDNIQDMERKGRHPHKRKS